MSQNDAIFYDSFDDLNKKLNKFIKNNKLRVKIARRGQKNYHKKFSSSKVADFIVKKTFQISEKYKW